MGISMLKLDRAKAKWRVKLLHAFEGQSEIYPSLVYICVELFFLQMLMVALARASGPFITVLREGLEAVVFVGGISLGQSASSIPIAAIVGIVCGLICGFIIYTFASRSSKYSCPF
jgi:high-affinity iron transporter